MESKLRDIAIGLVLICLTASAAAAQGTAFTYQGKLTEAGSPANGNYDLEFSLFDASAGGVQQGQTETRNPVTASAGVFTVTLDFGANVFSGAARYLEIGVRPASGNNPYMVLAPRQPIASTPYAIQSLSAATANSLSPACVACVTAAQIGSLPTDSGNYIQNSTALQATSNFNVSGDGLLGGTLGIGTMPAPGYKLDVNGQIVSRTGGIIGGVITLGTPNSETGLSIGNGTSRADIRFDGSRLKLLASTAGIPPATNGVVINTDGDVGIGTSPGYPYKLNVKSSLSGISAVSVSGPALDGFSSSDVAIRGRSFQSSGVFGSTDVASLSEAGVFGRGNVSGSIGVTGQSDVGNAVGVFGVSASSAGFGVYARNLAGGRALYAEGNAGQDLNANGFVKAMIWVDYNGSILRCYNGITNSYNGNCGFIVTTPLRGVYRINYGFAVAGRFVSVTCGYRGPYIEKNAGANYRFFDGTSIEVFTFVSGDSENTLESSFMIILY